MFEWEHLLRMQELTGIRKTRPNVLRFQIGIVVQDLLLRPPLRQKVNDELDGQPGSLDDRLSHQNIRTRDDPILPLHGFYDTGFQNGSTAATNSTGTSLTNVLSHSAQYFIPACSDTTCPNTSSAFF